MNKKFQNEDPDIKRMFDIISTTLTFVSQSYSHFYGYSFSDLTDEEQKLTNKEIFRFHKMTAQFFMIMQFCKLFESHSRAEEGDSSLIKMNKKLNEKYGPGHKKHSENSLLANKIKKSTIFKHIKELRNKCYGHAENHPLNPPLKFVFLKRGQLDEFKKILLDTVKIFNNCYALYDTNMTFHHFYDSSTPKNFLKNYARMKKFWKEKMAG